MCQGQFAGAPSSTTLQTQRQRARKNEAMRTRVAPVRGRGEECRLWVFRQACPAHTHTRARTRRNRAENRNRPREEAALRRVAVQTGPPPLTHLHPQPRAARQTERKGRRRKDVSVRAERGAYMEGGVSV